MGTSAKLVARGLPAIFDSANSDTVLIFYDTIRHMDKVHVEQFIKAIIPAVLSAGRFAMAQQGQVQNIGKDIQLRADDNDFLIQRKQAKTIIDERVQERLLIAAHIALAGQSVRIDAEEQTLSTQLFASQNVDTTLVIDPIDGTLQYLNGSTEYSINLALISKGNILMALQYFPAHSILYLLDAEGKPHRCLCDGNGIIEKQLLESPEVIKDEIIYVNHRVLQQECLAQKYTVIKDSDGDVLWTEAFFKCIAGEYKAALFVRPYIWDVVLGASIAAMPGGYAVDFKGNKVVWPDGGRISEIVFGFGTLPAEIRECLKPPV